MPALWQSSQRPMYIRTIWVDGFRHAVLTHDDPYFLKLCAKRRRPLSSSTYTSQKTSRTISTALTDIETTDQLKNFFVIKNVTDLLEKQNTDLIEKLNLSDVESDDDFTINASPHPLNVEHSLQLKLDYENMRNAKSNRTARNDVKENTELSDRVLQWLDLAGKVNLLTPENVERMSQPRHSWPEIQRRNLTKSKTATELRPKESKLVCDSKICDNIDRQEFYMPTSANTIETYARQSRNIKSTPRRDTKVKENKKVKDIKLNVNETRQKMVTERNAVQKQYSDMINKNLIPDLSNSKKQVHIFMPEAKKYGSNAPSRTESLLSHIS